MFAFLLISTSPLLVWPRVQLCRFESVWTNTWSSFSSCFISRADRLSAASSLILKLNSISFNQTWLWFLLQIQLTHTHTRTTTHTHTTTHPHTHTLNIKHSLGLKTWTSLMNSFTVETSSLTVWRTDVKTRCKCVCVCVSVLAVIFTLTCHQRGNTQKKSSGVTLDLISSYEGDEEPQRDWGDVFRGLC